MGLELNSIIKVQSYNFSPWFTNFNINIELTKFKKVHMLPIIYKNHLNEMLQNYTDDNRYYTDASKTEKGVGIAIINEILITRYKLPVNCSIYTAEVIAILKTIEHIYDHGNTHKNNTILTDSLSTLLSLKNTTNTTDLAKLIQQKIYELNNSGINITLIWVLGHNNMEGNEKANQEAKKAIELLDTPKLNITTFADTKNQIKELIEIKWQAHWNKQNTKLRNIKKKTFSAGQTTI